MVANLYNIYIEKNQHIESEYYHFDWEGLTVCSTCRYKSISYHFSAFAVNYNTEKRMHKYVYMYAQRQKTGDQEDLMKA